MFSGSTVLVVLIMALIFRGSSYIRVKQVSQFVVVNSLLTRQLTTNIAVVGKKNGVEPWIVAGINEYEKRLKPVMNINTLFFKNDDDLVEFCKSSKGTLIALDEKGRTCSSKEFCDMFYDGVVKGGATINFVVGAFDGLPNEIRGKYPLLSLSSMTWTHQMARLLLIEQIYRATEIHKGSGYHKE